MKLGRTFLGSCLIALAVLVQGCDQPAEKTVPQPEASAPVEQPTSGADEPSNPSLSESITEAESKPVVQEKPNGPTRYGIKSGTITYELKGFQEGIETVYFDDWGMKEVKLTQIMMKSGLQKNQKDEVHMITLMRDTMIYAIDLNTLNARTIDNSLLYELAEKSPRLDLDAVAKQMLLEKGGMIEKREKILGRECEVWNTPQANTKTWYWKGITLKTFQEMGSKDLNMVATSIHENVEIDPARFELPENTTLIDGPSMKVWMDFFEEINEKNAVTKLQ